MKVLKTILIILFVILLLGGGVIGSIMLVQNNALNTQHVHEIVQVQEVKASCTEAGVKQHYECKTCDEIFADADGYVKVEPADLAIAPIGHDFSKATCSEPQTCKNCGAKQGSAIGHTPGEAVKENVVAATCMNTGSYDLVYYCTVEGCGAEISRETKTEGKRQHTKGEAVKENVAAATCLNTGSYDLVYYCTVEGCGAEISRETKTTEKTTHVDLSPVDGKCDHCNTVLCEEHVAVVDAAIAPTCTTDGLTEGSHCSSCGVVLVPQQVIPAAHSCEIKALGGIIINNDGTYNTDNLVVALTCTVCNDYSEVVSEYTINAEDPINEGVELVCGELKFSIPALNSDNYDISTVKTGDDVSPVVTTTFVHKTTGFSCGIVTDSCIMINNSYYSVYDLALANNDKATVSFDADKGYFYASNGLHEVSYLATYGHGITITGDILIKTAVRVDCNSFITIGTEDQAANVTVERTALVSGNNHLIGLYNGADLTISNGTLKTIGIATGDWAVDVYAGHNGTVINIEEKGNYIAEGNGEYCIYTEKDTVIKVAGTITSVRGITHSNRYGSVVSGADDIYGCGYLPGFVLTKTGSITLSGKSVFSSILIDGTYTSNGGLTYINGANRLNDACEYGFIPGLYIRHGSVTLSDRLYSNSTQVGSEKENASGTLTVNTSSSDAFWGNNIKNTDDHFRCVFAKGSVNFTDVNGNKGKTAINLGTFDGELSIIEFKSGITFSLNNFEHFMGAWGKGYEMHWLIEDGATFVVNTNTGSTSFATISDSPNTRVITYKEMTLDLDGVSKTVRVANIASSTVANASDLVFPTVDSSASYTTDASAEVVNGYSTATDGNGNSIYYQIIE